MSSFNAVLLQIRVCYLLAKNYQITRYSITQLLWK